MAERLEQMHRLLKSTGSLYLHCDPTMSYGLRLVLDEIFGRKNFRNEVIWHYGQRTAFLRRNFSRKHDTLLFYAKSKHTAINKVALAWNKEEFLSHRHDVKIDENGRPFIWSDGRASGKRYKRMVDDVLAKGKPVDTVWDIPILNAAAKERLGYPTQKPLALLERIVKASSNEGDLVLDPFCGCGTAIEAAQRLGRRWAGIDISSFAIDLIREQRLRDPSIPVQGIPLDLTSARKLASEQPFNFESWAVTRLPGFAPNTRQVADGGVDGRATLADRPENLNSRLALAQVKGGRFSLSTLRDFIGVTDRDRAVLGYFVTLEPVTTSAARQAIAGIGKVRVRGQEYRRMQLWSIKDYFEDHWPRMPVMMNPYTGKQLNERSLF